MFKLGDSVVYIDERTHEKSPQYYPEVGTVGVIVEEMRSGYPFDFRVKWPDGSTSNKDTWLVHKEYISPFEEYSCDAIFESDVSVYALL